MFYDSDWAGCLKTRTWVNGGVLLTGQRTVNRCLAKSNATALKPAGAVLYAAKHANSEAKGRKPLGKDLGGECYGTPRLELQAWVGPGQPH